MSLAHARVHALQKGQEKLIEVVLAKVKVLLVVNDAHVVRQQSLAKTSLVKAILLQWLILLPSK